MALRQVLQLIKLLGLRRAARMKKRHEKALPLVRGYAATTCLWSLLNVGFWDDLAAAEDGPAREGLDLADYARRKGLDLHVLESVCSYLDGIRVVDLTQPRAAARGSEESIGTVRLTKRGRELLAEPRGLFELLYAYEPVFVELEGLLRGSKVYGRDVVRRTQWVGLGSGRLCRQLPYPMMMDMVRRHGRKCVLDLGCGDGAFLMELAKRQADLSGVGIDLDEPTVQLANEQIAAAGLSERLRAAVGDMFGLVEPRAEGAPNPDASGLGTPARGCPAVEDGELSRIDCLTACDTFHEYLWTSEQPVVELLRGLRAAFPKAILVVGEFCRQSHESLRKRPTAFLEHHLFHQLTNQRIESAERWREIFAQAGLTIREEKVFDLVGHGYFVLE